MLVLLAGGYGGRRYAVLLLEGSGEMGLVLEPHARIDIHDFLPALLHHGVGHFEPFADKPLFGRQVADLLEIPLEGGETPPGIVRQFLHRELVHVVLVHEVENVDLPRLVEVEQGGSEPLVDMEQSQQAFL